VGAATGAVLLFVSAAEPLRAGGFTVAASVAAAADLVAAFFTTSRPYTH
jgi:hypothetical protein